jgi:hypothetical protein
MVIMSDLIQCTEVECMHGISAKMPQTAQNQQNDSNKRKQTCDT